MFISGVHPDNLFVEIHVIERHCYSIYEVIVTFHVVECQKDNRIVMSYPLNRLFLTSHFLS